MGSEAGYEYRWQFSMVGLDEINSQHKSAVTKDGSKAFLFEFRTNFIMSPNPNPEQKIILDSESFDVMVHELGDAEKEATGLYFLTFKRLKDYWMTRDEIKLMLGQALDFTREAAADTQHAALNKIPVVVGLEVCTVQQDGESIEAAMGRAIRAQYLVPLYLWTKETPKQYKLRYGVLWLYFLWKLGKIRVENVDEGLAIMQACHICSRATTIGAQITVLPICGHAFHTRCLWVWLEDNEKCPLCGDPAYDVSRF